MSREWRKTLPIVFHILPEVLGGSVIPSQFRCLEAFCCPFCMTSLAPRHPLAPSKTSILTLLSFSSTNVFFFRLIVAILGQTFCLTLFDHLNGD